MGIKYTGVFSHMQKQTMDSVISSVYEYLAGKSNNIPLHEEAMAYSENVVKVVTVPGLREFTSEDDAMANMVAEDMAEMMREAKEEMVNNDPFAEVTGTTLYKHGSLLKNCFSNNIQKPR